jgi:adenosylcobalamin-dependent ribonucleoside-triphosphate reductase
MDYRATSDERTIGSNSASTDHLQAINNMPNISYTNLESIIRQTIGKTIVPIEDLFQVAPGMAQKVWESKYSRVKATYKDEKGETVRTYQNWQERLLEVVGGNFMLDRNFDEADLQKTWEYAARGIIPMAGRHLQHGDFDQANKKLEKFCNCATALATFTQFKLGLDGCGIGADYSTAVRRVNWDNMPYIRVVLSSSHPDFGSAYNEMQGGMESLEEAREKYPSESESVRWLDVEDSCEGWVRAVAAMETAAYHEKHREKTFIYNFTPVREEGRPIAGQQGRPASGPLPLMRAFLKIASIRGAGMQPWKQAMFIDHYLASCIVLGGVRRMARIATKYWKDRDIFDFIEIKRGGGLWSANNSILVDKQFWEEAKDPRTHAARVFQSAIGALYYDRSGEPGFINVDQLTQPSAEEKAKIDPAEVINREYYGKELHPKTYEMLEKITTYALKQPYWIIINPCAEVPLATLGGFCLVGDTNMARVKSKEEFIDAVACVGEMLVRVNRMESIYKQETDRTNRIGVSMIGVHEGAWNLFGLKFADLIADYDYLMRTSVEDLRNHYSLTENVPKNLAFWLFIDEARQSVENRTSKYSKKLGMNAPETATVMKPGGTVTKVMSTTESANLPAFVTYLRWIQYDAHIQGEVIERLKNCGYPVKDISVKADGSTGYPGKVVVGFPTKLPIVDLMGAENVTTAADVSVDDHYRWLALLEKFWLGTNKDGSSKNGQISYTLKVKVENYTFEEFKTVIGEWQPQVRCCAIDFVQDVGSLISAYAYVPEEPISVERYQQMMADIIEINPNEISGPTDAELQCASGICPIEQDNYIAPETEAVG